MARAHAKAESQRGAGNVIDLVGIEPPEIVRRPKKPPSPYPANVLDSYEAAAYLRIHFKTVNRLAAKGIIPGQKVGARWRFLRAVLDEWLEGQSR